VTPPPRDDVLEMLHRRRQAVSVTIAMLLIFLAVASLIDLWGATAWLWLAYLAALVGWGVVDIRFERQIRRVRRRTREITRESSGR